MKRVWTTKTGERVKIRDMETSHIVNCVLLLERFNRAREDELYALPSMFQGEMAVAAAEDIVRTFEEEGWDDWTTEFIESFEAEINRRGPSAIDLLRDRRRKAGPPDERGDEIINMDGACADDNLWK